MFQKTLKVKPMEVKINLKFSKVFFLSSLCLSVEWKSSCVRYCPGNHNIFQATDMACQNFESLHRKILH